MTSRSNKTDSWEACIASEVSPTSNTLLDNNSNSSYDTSASGGGNKTSNKVEYKDDLRMGTFKYLLDQGMDWCNILSAILLSCR